MFQFEILNGSHTRLLRFPLRNLLMVQEVTKDSAIPVEKADAQLLMIAGEDDWNSDGVR